MINRARSRKGRIRNCQARIPAITSRRGNISTLSQWPFQGHGISGLPRFLSQDLHSFSCSTFTHGKMQSPRAVKSAIFGGRSYRTDNFGNKSNPRSLSLCQLRIVSRGNIYNASSSPNHERALNSKRGEPVVTPNPQLGHKYTVWHVITTCSFICEGRIIATSHNSAFFRWARFVERVGEELLGFL